MSSVEILRSQARNHIEQGAVTAGYSADRQQVLKLLNDALATELVCVLRYRRHHFMARGIYAKGVADEFLLHSNEEQGHADLLAGRIDSGRFAARIAEAAAAHARMEAGEHVGKIVLEVAGG